MVSMGEGIGAAIHYEMINLALMHLICRPPAGAPRSLAELEARLDRGVLKDLWKHDAMKLRELDRIKDGDIADLARKLNVFMWEFQDLIRPDGFTLEGAG